MAWLQGTDKQTKQQWLARFAKERLNLSVSVEEALADSSVQEDLLLDEPDSTPDTTGEPISDSHSTAIIPPKLSLQSRPMPAVHIESSGPVNGAKADAVPAPSTRPVETPARSQKKQRLAGRTTKVRLQAVPKTEKKANERARPEKNNLDHEQRPVVEHQTEVVSDARLEFDGVDKAIVEKQVGASISTRGKLSGSSTFESGQEEASIKNPLISSSSVVIVTLIGDPGPVVVHYVTLQPETGFTVHLSAPAVKKTLFNYVILMTELF
jgi:hypothetical protein